MSRADAHLTIPPQFAGKTGFRWSLGCDAVEAFAGPTVALAAG